MPLALLGVLASKGHLVQHPGRFHLIESSRQSLLPGSAYYCGRHSRFAGSGSTMS